MSKICLGLYSLDPSDWTLCFSTNVVVVVLDLTTAMYYSYKKLPPSMDGWFMWFGWYTYDGHMIVNFRWKTSLSAKCSFGAWVCSERPALGQTLWWWYVNWGRISWHLSCGWRKTPNKNLNQQVDSTTDRTRACCVSNDVSPRPQRWSSTNVTRHHRISKTPWNMKGMERIFLINFSTFG